ncbi:F-box protein [Cardamine amara subsp. amara]|uniref:F-box protein n=1 Tax=Cardamine amara subsp. amara TaxID=228776 RepID=A0ABD0ZE73_CARAN
MVVNPTTRWLRRFPYSTYQLLKRRRELKPWQRANLGFGKDITNGTFKPVWVYNSNELWLDNKNNNAATVCEVFDFSIDAWRLVVPASTYPIIPCQHPVYSDGSLHWFTTKTETTVLSFDLHNESFQVSKTPFLLHQVFRFGMCNLDDRLCVYEEMWGNQVIWSFDSEHKTWKKIYSIDLIIITSSIDTCFTVKPLAVVDKEKLLMVCDAEFGVELLIYDPKTKSCELAYTSKDHITADRLCYFQSLISIV